MRGLGPVTFLAFARAGTLELFPILPCPEPGGTRVFLDEIVS
jgi:hypothetical protein